MLQALRSIAVCLLLLTAGAGLAAETKPLAREDMASDAVRLAESLRTRAATIGAQTKEKTPDDLRRAVAAAPKDPANWLAYASVAVKADDAKANGRWDLVTEGATAAYAAYQRSATAEGQAAALATLSDLLARHEMWRPALDALHASLDKRDNLDLRKTYEDMREQHGFRILLQGRQRVVL